MWWRAKKKSQNYSRFKKCWPTGFLFFPGRFRIFFYRPLRSWGRTTLFSSLAVSAVRTMRIEEEEEEEGSDLCPQEKNPKVRTAQVDLEEEEEEEEEEEGKNFVWGGGGWKEERSDFSCWQSLLLLLYSQVSLPNKTSCCPPHLHARQSCHNGSKS